MKRTAEATVRFSVRFQVPGVKALQPPGMYRVACDEELLEGTSRLAWRRVAAFIHLPSINSNVLRREMVPITPAELDILLRTAGGETGVSEQEAASIRI